MILTTKQIVEVLELEKKATEGPWRAYPTGMNLESMRSLGILCSHNRTPYIHVDNADFIAAFRNIARDLMEEVLAGRDLAKFYGDESNWEAPTSSPESYETTCITVSDEDDFKSRIIGGKRARAHLDRFVKGEK